LSTGTLHAINDNGKLLSSLKTEEAKINNCEYSQVKNSIIQNPARVGVDQPTGIAGKEAY